ncbi:MAG: ABC transporter permease [Kiritimatiellae bacterium]|nr:ABC transporter permease [Kiritimatiellia bacterium]
MATEKESGSIAERTGFAIVSLAREVGGIFEFCGRLAAAVWRACFSRNMRSRLPGFADIFMRAGAEAVPVTMLVGFLLGFIIAYMSAAMLNKFGAEIYVANLIGLSLIKELGIIVAAIVIAARSASAFAAEIGTMTVNDEISAMRTMGIDPVGYLVLPRIVAGALALPLLSLFADLAGLVGGYLTLAMFGYSAKVFLTNAFSFCAPADLVTSLAKGVVFGIAISAAGCRCGLSTGLGADAVGKATTKAVVSSLVLFIAMDGIFALILSARGA